jgi:paraquat-inducible protein A
MNNNSALAQGFISCHDCNQTLVKTPELHYCPVCNSVLHARLVNSLQRTSALLLSAFFLYIPANMFPIMTVTKLNVGEPHNIIGGIISLIHSDMIPIALLVLVASILVPLLKMIGLSLLILSVHYRWRINKRLWTRIYRLIALVGRWSMLDIFMISILVSLVDLGAMAQVIAGPAATAFAAVVVLTMFATKTFDVRLLWDYSDE